MQFTKMEGPGNRACIWVQGCNKQCPGCAAPWTWDPEDGIDVDVHNLSKNILDIPNIEGVTFSGGEPFLQAAELYSMVKILKRKSKLSIVIFTGFYLEEIIEADTIEWKQLLSVTDLLVAGPYEKEKPSKIPLIGSSNQKIHFLSKRYLHLKQSILNNPKQIEIHIKPDSTVIVNGNIEYDFIKELLNGMSLKK